MCGFVGVVSGGEDVASELYEALICLQHRGQDAAGLVTFNGQFHLKKGNGLVRDVFRAKNMERLLVKWQTAAKMVPAAEIVSSGQRAGILYYGTSSTPMPEALDLLSDEDIHLDTLRVRGFPFGEEVYEFVENHDFVFVVDQNRDGQMKTLLVNEGQLDPARLVSILYYGGLSISADTIQAQVSDHFTRQKLPRLREVKS